MKRLQWASTLTCGEFVNGGKTPCKTAKQLQYNFMDSEMCGCTLDKDSYDSEDSEGAHVHDDDMESAIAHVPLPHVSIPHTPCTHCPCIYPYLMHPYPTCRGCCYMKKSTKLPAAICPSGCTIKCTVQKPSTSSLFLDDLMYINVNSIKYSNNKYHRCN
jgi:hypothetical protein